MSIKREVTDLVEEICIVREHLHVMMLKAEFKPVRECLMDVDDTLLAGIAKSRASLTKCIEEKLNEN